MRRVRGGGQVEKGTYWDPRSGLRVDLKDSGVLPGGAETLYLRVSPAGMLLIGPITGGLHVLTLPLAAIATVTVYLALGLRNVVLGVLGRMVSFGWRPLESHLSGGRRRKRKIP